MIYQFYSDPTKIRNLSENALINSRSIANKSDFITRPNIIKEAFFLIFISFIFLFGKTEKRIAVDLRKRDKKMVGHIRPKPTKIASKWAPKRKERAASE